MAEVFLAAESGEHSLGRLVVIKRILPHLAEDESFVEMFLHEARIAARISHPNVVQIYELGESGGFPYIAMEYIEGSTLKELQLSAKQANVQLPVGAVVHLMTQALAGAHAAHELKDSKGRAAGLVHRDLSPHNLMVTPGAHVKLLDFGIAKATQSRVLEATRTGVLKGKISYMSPEQCRQEPLDRRSDVYALGIVCWEMFAGRKLFAGMSELATMQAIVNGDLRDLHSVRSDVPLPIIEVMKKALATRLSDRWASADDFRKGLLSAAEEAGVDLSQDKTATLVKTLLGELHEQRRRHVETAMEKTLVTLSAVRLPSETALTTQTTVTSTSMVQAGMVGAVSFFAALGISGGAVLLLVALAVGGLVWWQATDVPVGPQIVGADYVPTGDPIKIVVGAPTDVESLRADYAPLAIYLQPHVERPVQFEFAERYEGAQKAVLDGTADYGILPPNTFVDAYEKNDKVDVLAIKRVEGSKGSAGYLITKLENPANDLAALKGTHICHADPLSTTGYILPRAYILEKGMDPDVDFIPVISGNHFQVMRDVIAGTCDIGAVYSGALNTADKKHGIQASQLRVFAQTGLTPHDAVVASPSADPVISAKLKKALLAFEPEVHIGAPLLGKVEKISGFVDGSKKDFESFGAKRAAVKAHEAARAAGTKGKTKGKRNK